MTLNQRAADLLLMHSLFREKPAPLPSRATPKTPKTRRLSTRKSGRKSFRNRRVTVRTVATQPALPKPKVAERKELPRNFRQRLFSKAFGWPEEELNMASTQESGHSDTEISQAVEELREYEKRCK
ncbi:hypothetical protein L596_025029 [Steinernema carpocapsae]|uniref:Uncharacterized protein n=1 Tax=Steinernema carpocapsae TaxID=34508 RepID=A0A4U5M7F6_STECR|nr:hypothetical protein L596_025029 [Steinernema carpocapsae]